MKNLLIFLISIILPMMAHADISGKCGNNLTWSYEESTQTLTISGTGSMYNYSSYDNKAPWYGNYDYYLVNKIKSIVIESGVTSIGNSAFYFCTALETIKIPESVISIGSYSFQNCSSLTSINIPERVNSIGQFAFYECNKLASINIPNSVNDIGLCAFELTAWYDNQPEGLIYAGKVAYRYKGTMSPNTSIILLDGTKSISSSAFRGCTGLTSVIMPEGMTTIGSEAFQNCSSLSDFNIPNSVTDIGINAFDNTAWLNNQPSGLVYAGKFLYTYLGKVPEGACISIEEGTIGIVSSAFSGCEGLKEIDLPNSITSIGSYAFNNCTNLTSIILPQNITDISSNTFHNCKSLASITLPNYITSIGDKAFEFCTSLSSITIPSSVISIGDNSFHYCSSLSSVTLTEGIKSIGNCAFQECGNLTSITIPNSVSKIGYSTFQSCPALISAVLGNGLSSIESSTFNSCTSLNSVTIGNNITKIGNNAFEYCTSLSSFIIPDQVTSIGDNAFSNCIGLSSITIGKDVANVGKNVFDGCSNLSSINFKCNYVGNYFREFPSIKEILFEKTVSYIGDEAFKNCSGLSSVSFEDGVENIYRSAFSGCISLLAVSFPKSLQSIGEKSFYDCSSLTTINIPEGVTTIGSEAFYGCRELTSVYISKGVNKIGNGVLANCDNLSSIIVDKENQVYDSRNDCNAIIYTVTNTLISGCVSTIIPNTVNTIGYLAFGGCSGLSSVEIPNSVTKVETYAFQGCSGLNSIVVDKENQVYDSRNNSNAIIKTSTNELVCGCNNTTIPNSVTSIAYNAFYGCRGLVSIHIPESVTSINDNSFDECTGLSSITVDVKNPKYDSRDDCNAIIETESNRLIVACNSSSIPSSVTSYSQSAFNSCASLSLPDGLQEITSNMFISCDKLITLKIPSSVVKISEGAFNDCSSLKTVIFEDGAETLNFEVNYPAYYSKPQWFSVCPLDSVYIGRDIKYDFTPSGGYGTYFLSPFREKETLRKVVLGDNVTIIPNAMFDGCSNFIAVVTPEKMDSIGYSAFKGCVSLSSITLPDGIRTISSSTFNGCKSLMSINIPETVKTIDEQAFYYCEGLTSLDIPNSVRRIGRLAFGMCTSLSNLKFQDGETSLTIREDRGMTAFSQCPISSVYLGRNIINDSYNYIYSSLGSINTPFDLTISKYVTELEGGTFANCVKIKTLKFEEGSDTLTLINDHNAYSAIMPFATTPIDSIYMGRIIVGKDLYYPERFITPFANVGSSFVMRVGDNITEIGNRSFSGWMTDSLYIPNNVTKIGADAFANCYSLNFVKIEDSSEKLEFTNGDALYGCFYGCQLSHLYLGRSIGYESNKSPFRNNKEALKNVTFGDQVTEIGEDLFAGCKNIPSILFPNNLKKIGSKAFYGCESLTEIRIPNSVTEIGEDAFNLTRGLTFFTIEDGTEDLSINNNFLNSPLSEVYLGRNIAYPEGLSPFSMLESLKVLKIGKDVSNIHDRAFAGCQNLKDVVSYAVNVPTTGQNVFTESYLSDATLHVLDQAYKDYSKSYPWYLFKNFMLIDADGNETPLPSSEGDASDNGMVNAEDVVEVVSHMMGYPSEGFNNKYADVNCDGIINIADIVSIVNIIMGQ